MLAAIALDMTCTSGEQFVVRTGSVRFGSALEGSSRGLAPPTAGSNGATYTGTDSLTARLNRGDTQLSGMWQLKVNYSFTDGMSDQCDSGPVRFAATGCGRAQTRSAARMPGIRAATVRCSARHGRR